ncbi:MAG: peptidase [Candidatus Eisenbacteria bacterium]|uniref:Peptidase n=1 Tax=Eiseniibacteriota bacterium TaxID=2212470 RepID=A0A849SE71_UNCEI|nr:peptidase [Candidatus Eisenbacteria bacterium]
MRQHPRTSALTTLAFAALMPCAAIPVVVCPVLAANITIVNADGAGEGFNDPTAAVPVGGNAGATVGAQRLIVFQTAANYWGTLLPSAVTIRVNARFDPLTCTPTGAVLGSAGPLGVFRDFGGAEFAGHWYHSALANKLAGFDLDGGDDIQAQFNSNLNGSPGCLGGAGWYLGLDGVEGINVDLLPVVMHELGHGLGFSTTTNGTTGNYLSGFPALWDHFLLDRVTSLHWDQMSAGQRAASAISNYQLSWDGDAATFESRFELDPRPENVVTAPAGIAGTYLSGKSLFGAALTTGGVTAQVVQALDGSGSTTDACEAITNGAALSGKIAFVDRGTCPFTQKALNVQAAGAVGIIIANNVNTGAFEMLATNGSVTIPVTNVDQIGGNLIRPQLAGGVTATMRIHPTARAGTDDLNRPLLYTPNPFQGGSSVSHFEVLSYPNALMEPAINLDLAPGDVDLTRFLFEDIGWLPRTTGVSTPAASRAASVVGAPNPFQSSAVLRFELSRPGLVDLSVFDTQGRLVRRITNAWMPAGPHGFEWNGLDDAGREVGAGVFLSRLRTGDGDSYGRLVRVN